ncbi:helix-hairpin-helix domain-containing protein [Pseudomonas fluorescens]|jgi:competence protein ComEA|uniref:ComEA family DNA-binding protein n=1 Tax=Pseudomonas TaxID=286 RepID=UPI000BA2F6C1|nr:MULTISPECIES: helix-hairpin-helix domain-containing protein [Pseudomonas]MCO7628139.1 helix-hairpin-helix domain-containing protein [Pseudomonas fluorescens]
MSYGFFRSLVLAVFATLSISAIAAPVVDSSPAALEISEKRQDERIDLNAADAGTLQRELTGVGKSKAQAIVAYRDINGPFSSVDELLEVKGVGKTILETNKEKLQVK